MAEPSKQSEDGFRQHPVRWDNGDWKRIEQAAEVLSAREHLSLNPTDIIRSGTLRFVEELLGTERVSENRRSTDGASAR